MTDTDLAVEEAWRRLGEAETLHDPHAAATAVADLTRLGELPAPREPSA